jgi:uncharacterized protein with ParB-like and HNH nuclease domain
LYDSFLTDWPIKNLLDKTFYVESYQRGYRWGKKEVSDLLQDLYDYFIDGEDKRYWLQPVIVTEQILYDENNSKVTCYELIDGQQRITTIFLILYFLNHPQRYKIKYRTRTSSENFLDKNKLDRLRSYKTFDEFINDPLAPDNKADDRIDNYHIFIALRTIMDWFINQPGVEQKFLDNLIDKTYIIWYQLLLSEQGQESQDNKTIQKSIFEQINIGKIPLTNAELIKALYLKNADKSAWGDEIAEKWDRIEYALQDQAFWSFINKSERKHNRIEFILDLVAGKYKDANIEEKLHTFLFFLHSTNLYESWQEVEKRFNTLVEWYEKPDLYHLIGYLVFTELSKIHDLLELYQKGISKPKSDFLNDIKLEIKSKLIAIKLEDLNYEREYDRKQILRVLLLFNIDYILTSSPYNYFPFYIYRLDEWSLEHIHAQHSKNLIDPEAIRAWVKETIPEIEKQIDNLKKGDEAKVLLHEMNEVLKQGINIKLNGLSAKVFEFFGGDLNEVHHIFNLALLDRYTNSFLSNHVFSVKRRKIFNAAKERRAFIPECTKNAFLKYYSSDISHMYFWNKEDRIDYMNHISKVFNKYIEYPYDANRK